LRAFNNAKNTASEKVYRNDQICSQICINYICSLLATSGKEIIPVNIFLDSVRFLIKFFKGKFHSKKDTTEHFETFTSNSECSERRPRATKKTIKVEDKLFYINVIQGLSYILTFKIPEIESQDPALLKRMLKLVLNNEHKAILFNQKSLLSVLLQAFKTHRIQPKYIRRLSKLMKDQNNFLRYKNDLFNRVKRKMPFGTPLFLIESGVYFEHFHSHLPNNQIQESISSVLIPPENKKNFLKKKSISEEEEKSPKQTVKREVVFEKRKLNAVMIAAFGRPKNAQAEKDIRQTIFGKLGRSLSVDYKHKQKSN